MADGQPDGVGDMTRRTAPVWRPSLQVLLAAALCLPAADLAAAPSFQLHYRVRLDEPPVFSYHPLELASPVASPDEGLVLAGTHEELVAVAADLGTVSWRARLDGAAVGIPLLDAGRVFVGTDNGAVHALCVADGSAMWEEPARLTGIPQGTMALWRNQLLFVMDDKSVLRAVDAGTGKLLHSYGSKSFTERGISPFTMLGAASPSLDPDSDVLYAAFENGDVVAFRLGRFDQPSGEPLSDALLEFASAPAQSLAGEPSAPGYYRLRAAWSAALCSAGGRSGGTEDTERLCPARRFFSDSDSTPTRTRFGLLAGCQCRGLYLLDPSTGLRRWQLPIPGPSSPLVANDRAFLASTDGSLYAADLAAGAVLWRTDLGISFLTRPVLVGREDDLTSAWVAVATGESVYVLDAASGTIRYKVSPTLGVSAAPLVFLQAIYFLSNEGILYRVDFFG